VSDKNLPDPYQAFVYTGPVKDDKGHAESLHIRLHNSQRGMILKLINDNNTPWDDIASVIRSAIAFFFESLENNVQLRASLRGDTAFAKAERLLEYDTQMRARAQEMSRKITNVRSTEMLAKLELLIPSFPEHYQESLLRDIQVAKRFLGES
jgi:hypothetical protein